jgi:hypothetical protein
MNTLSTLIVSAASVLLCGCIKDELPVPSTPRGDERSAQFCLGTGYQQQLWIDLADNSVVRQNELGAWDLAFESAPDGWRIMVNGGRLMLAWSSGVSDITETLDLAAVPQEGRIDAPSAHPDSTAIGDWRTTDQVFVLDLGYDALGLPKGFRRIRPISVDAQAYTIEVAQADGSEVTTTVIPKDPQRGWVHFSFEQGVVQVSPVRGAWDIVLTRYTHNFEDIVLPYIVVGALIDGTDVRVSRITGKSFAEVSLTDTVQHPFEQRRDIIGYNWKEYSFETSSYTCLPDLVYILRNAQGVFYKLHFLDFYGSQGQAGCPLYAVKEL